MHFGNGQAEALRKDGASPPLLGLRICPLFLLAAGLLLGLGSGARAGWCQPCPGNCTCANDSCQVNCSGAGLQELEAVPTHVTVLDLSNNNIETLDQELFEQLQNLTEINLSDNPWSCDCRLSWLPRWVAESGISVVQADSTVCDRPYVASGQQLFNVSFSKSLCGSDLIYCPPSPSSDNESVLIFVSISLTHASNETCSAQCYAELYNYWVLDSKHGCLCGDVLPANASLRCREVCDTPSLVSGCGLTIIQDVLRTESFTFLHASSDLYRLGEVVHLQVEAPIRVIALLWDLGSQHFSTSEVSITHRYAQPGMYNVTVTLRFGRRDLLLHEELRVVGIPEEVTLLCPSVVRTNETVDVRVMTRGGTDVEVQYTVTSQEDMAVSPVCPPGSVVYPSNNHCYQLISEKAGWFEAQKTCQEWENGDMAVVSSLELQSFLKAHVTSGLEVWIGFNDSRSSESLPAGKRFDLESCQNWLPGQPEPSQADRCVRMGPNGVCNTDLCSATHNYVCEYKPQAISLSAEYFVVGSGVFDTNWPLQNLTRVESIPPSVGGVKVLVFPGLRFSREVYISALEFVTEKVLEPVHLRFQVYTQSIEQDCPAKSTSSPPSSLPIQESLPECEEELDTSNYTNSNLTYSLMAQSNKNLPNFVLVKEYLYTIPAGNATQYLATFEDVSIQMLPNYHIVLQHDAPNKTFLHCHSSRSYHAFHQSDWVSCIPGNLLGETLINSTSESWSSQREKDGGCSCSLRVVGTTEEVTLVFTGRLNPGLWPPGKYTITANFTNQLYEATQSHSFSVVSPVSGVSVVYPTPIDEIYYIPSDNPVVILKILSGSDATAFWAGSNQTWSFSRTCPPKISAVSTECARGGDVSYSEVNLLGLGKGVGEVSITVQNEISSTNITFSVKMEDPIRGLSTSPYPQARVLLNTRVNNVASVEAGSDVIFKWTVDDRSSFTYYNTVFNVIYQSAAVYKLTLTASNHVSNASVSYNVTVEKMNPMRDLKITNIPAIVTQNDSLQFSARILIDSAVDVTFRWTFGDGTQLDYNVRPPYNQSFSVPDPAVHMVLVESSVTHTYLETGAYIVSLVVFNKYENVSKLVSLQVQSILTNLSIETDADVLVKGRIVNFHAAAEPSPFGVIYSWDLGDGTFYHNISEPNVNHTYDNTGSFNVSIWAINDISEIRAVQNFCVYEEITGLVIASDEPTERGLQTFINASVESGDSITWRFDMGDGYILEGNEPMVNYTYSKDGNYTVNVTASNPVNSISERLQVRVYVLQILKIEPSTCILENSNVTLTAYVTGDYQTYTFNWTFDNGSSSITVYGVPSVEYDFSKSGLFPLSLILSSQVNKAYYYTNICIEPEIANVTLLPALQNISLGNESLFHVIVFPPYQYRYNWDFGTNGSKINGGTEISFMYKVPGVYQVTVSVFNNVSSHNGTAIVDVQEPVGTLNIKHNGSEVLALDEVYLFEALSGGTKVGHDWDFGDGCTDQRQTVAHTYNKTGTFIINLYGYNSVSCNRTHLNVTVKTRIYGLTMNATRTVVPLNGSVVFSAFLQAGDNVRYSWILCDRCTPINGSSTIYYTFRSIGTFNVIVTAENELGSLQDSIFIYVLEIIEGLQIITGDLVNDCCFPTNKSLPLQATVKDGTNISYSWFILKNDSVVQTGAGKTYQFTSLQPESYTIVLKAVNMLGNASVSMNVVFVESLGQLKLHAHPNPVAVNTTVNITMSLSSGSGVMYTWYLEESVVWFTYESFVLYNFLTPNPKDVLAVANNTLGSVNSTITIFVQEPVESVSITSLDHKSEYVPNGTLVSLTGSVQRGTNVSWCWSIEDEHKEGSSVAVLFDKPGFYTVKLNASNDVSWEIAYKNFTVQDKISGLKLLVSKMVVEPGERVTFNVIMSAGTDVTYKLTINGDFSVLLNGTSYTYEFTKIGGYPVTVVAHNQVSEERDTVMISVLEAIENLKIVNCCELALPARVEKSFRAEVSNGSLVAYTWQFDLQGHPPTSLAGRNVTYTPVAAGVLTIHLSASNALGSQNISKVIIIQELIVSVSLVDVKAFVNRSATFSAIVVPSPLDIRFEWTFGDNSLPLVTYTAAANHTYLIPGDFIITVNASNLISYSISDRTVTTRILECEEPEVQLEMPTQVIMRRSQRNYIEAEINLRGCISYKTEHLWEIYKASSCLSYHESDKIHLVNVDMSRPQLVLPKLALDIGNYCFVFSVSFGDTPLSRSSFANVTMMPSRLVPIIDGGSYRVWSSSRDLILDGKKSYDPNLEENEQTPLTYKWSCTTLTKNLENTVCNSEVMSELGEVSIHKSKLHPDVEYTFFLTVSKPGRHAESTNQTVYDYRDDAMTCWRDTEDEVALVFILRAKRCRGGHCDDFWVYKGSRSEHSTFLPVGYNETNFMVELSIMVQDQQGAIAVALNHSVGISMPMFPEGFQSLGHWLHNLTEGTLQGLLKQGDPQHVAEYSLALITVLNEYERGLNKEEISKQNLGFVRKQITDVLISLKVNTVDDIRQIAAALAQCTMASKELACASCQRKTLSKLEAMMSILQNETTQGMMTPTTIADNILNITGDVIHLVNTKSSVNNEGKLCGGLNNVTVASEAYNLSSDLMRIMMKSRVLNEEPLTLQGGEILARGKRSDPLNLLCYSNRTGCQFFIPQGFNSTFPDLTDIIQVMIQVDSNPYPFGFISNYTVSTKVASMEFQTSNGSQIPVESLDSEKAITVSVANNTGVGNITAGVATIESRRSVKVDIEAESSNENAGLHIQITYKVQDEWYSHMEQEPYISAYLHESDHPNQYNYSAMKQITLDAINGDDHKLYTFFIAPT
uniref:Polycystin-1 n=1 Tax=Pyxicephalus adspersus TaxID=30357 RepID=A0AAV3A2T4_PYXAD|nr:TPA: hypothetical protein GDO54_015156 [Pyxicephalus adspersus]